jgi:RimJ/RimL family protein N-acetyltransferase
VTVVPELETPRLAMRGWRTEDIDSWAAIVADDDAMRALGRERGLTYGEAWNDLAQLAGHWALKGFGQWALVERESGELVGRTGLIYPADWPDLEVGWLVRADRRGLGYATEAGAAALRWAFEQLGADHVISLIADDNPSSRRVAEKLGERPDRTVTVRGEELMAFRIDRDAWRP